MTRMIVSCVCLVSRIDNSLIFASNVPEDWHAVMSEITTNFQTGQYSLIFAHPELIKSRTIRRILQSRVYQSEVCCTVVDEVHIVSEWGKEFRKAFAELEELTCIFSKVPHLAVTATATPESITDLCSTLQFDNAVKIVVSPNRPNIEINRRRRLPHVDKYTKYDDLLNQIVPDLKQQSLQYPVTVVYVDNLEAMSYSYQFTENYLGQEAYHPKDIQTPENRIFAQFHKDYTPIMKQHIVSELRKKDPKLRLVFATVALGMGLNSPCISRIIHYRPPTTLEQYMQEIGRAGRAGQPSQAILFFNNSDIASNRNGLSLSVTPFCQTDTCLRQHLLKHFEFDIDKKSSSVQVKCCSNCAKSDDIQLHVV